MDIPTTGYSSSTRQLGGFGSLGLKLSGSTGICRLVCKFVSGTGTSSSFITLNGFRIGTEVFGINRVIHVYEPSISVDAINPTLWEGLPLEMACGLSGNALICDHDGSPVSSPTPSEKAISIGGSNICKTNADHLYVKSKGTPDEESEIILGNRIISVGRFGDHWALGVKKSTP